MSFGVKAFNAVVQNLRSVELISSIFLSSVLKHSWMLRSVHPNSDFLSQITNYIPCKQVIVGVRVERTHRPQLTVWPSSLDVLLGHAFYSIEINLQFYCNIWRLAEIDKHLGPKSTARIAPCIQLK